MMHRLPQNRPQAPTPPLRLDDVEAAVDEVIRRVGSRINIGAPLALGKPAAFLNALVKRAVKDADLHVEIQTALTLMKPRPRSELEKRLAGPILERLLGGVPEFEYARLRSAGKLPPNVNVREFYVSPGSALHDAYQQQNYMSLNYSHVLEAMRRRGANLVVAEVAPNADGSAYSFGSNPDLSLEEFLRAQSAGVATLAVVNRQMPFMPGEAVVPAETFDVLVDNEAYDHPLFGTPREEVPLSDHLIGLNVSALIRDGGTLQVGIGSLGDAVTNALILRNRDNLTWRRLLESTGTIQTAAPVIEELGGLDPFDRGLYANTEMWVDGFRHLYDAGLLRRRVFDDLTLMRLEQAGRLPQRFDADALALLVEEGVVPAELDAAAVQKLCAHGILAPDVRLVEGRLHRLDRSVVADLGRAAARREIADGFVPEVPAGKIAHAAFFLGHPSLYQWLRDLPLAERARIQMTGVDYTNRLLGGEDLKTAQRRHGRFVNTSMMVTLLGAAVSDGLEDGRVVSGVGGQAEFVLMGQQLEGARGILMLRSTRTRADVRSNIVFSYGHCTVPRHLRDVVVTEYGIADLRGKSDREVVEGLLSITDSRFQAGLAEQAKKAGKLPRDWQLPDAWRRNTPQRLEAAVAHLREALPPFPFGNDLTDEEQTLKNALLAVKQDAERKRPGLKDLVRTTRIPKAARPYLERMGLERPRSMQERTLRRVVVYGLARVGAV